MINNSKSLNDIRMLFLYNLTFTVIITIQISADEDHQSNQHYEDQLDYPPFPHDYPPYHHGFWNNYIQPVNNQVNQPTHPSQNRQIYTQNFVRLNSRSNIITNQNQASENSENNDISLLIQSHAKITALVFDRENPKS